jgi:2-oxoglutarate ferredoxin oxidoreductase subunit gamma
MMRGGNSDSTVVLGTERLLTPPTVSRAWGSMALHQEYWSSLEPRLMAGGIVVIDRSVFRGEVGRADLTLVEIEATSTAAGMGIARAASMVALGALSAATGIVSLAALEAATSEVLPPYRAQHAAANAEAVRAGYALIDFPVVESWPERTAGARR